MILVVVSEFYLTLNKVSGKWERVRTDTLENIYGYVFVTFTYPPDKSQIFDNLDDAKQELGGYWQTFSENQATKDGAALIHFALAGGVYTTKIKTQMNLGIVTVLLADMMEILSA